MAESDKSGFNNYVEGALEVYSQFKRPSKEESEKFYSFLKTKWNNTDCSKACSKAGYAIGQQYAKEQNIEIKSKQDVQSPK